MTIRITSVTVTPEGVQLTAPGNFGSFQAVRLANFSGTVMVITGIDPDDPGCQQYLLPLQQNVYKTQNTATVPIISGISSLISTTSLVMLAEWSDDPLRDFPGTYPTAVSLAASTPSLAVTRMPNIPQWFGPTNTWGPTNTIPANPLRKSIALQHTGLTPAGFNTAPWGNIVTTGSPNHVNQTLFIPPEDTLIWYGVKGNGTPPLTFHDGGYLAPGERIELSTTSTIYLWLTTAINTCVSEWSITVTEQAYL